MAGRHIELENKKFWLAIGAFVVQGAGTVFYLGTQTQTVRDEVSVLKRDLSKIEANQTLLLQLVRDVAVLQAKDVEIEKRLDKIERK